MEGSGVKSSATIHSELTIGRRQLLGGLCTLLPCGFGAVSAAQPNANVSVIDKIRLQSPSIAYQPSGFEPYGESDPGLLSNIKGDLHLLFDYGFRGLVTYGADGFLGDIPKIARTLGFDGVIIMGVWNPKSRSELERAVDQRQYVDGYAVGNEGLDKRYSFNDVDRAFEFLRTKTSLPATTTEPIDSYLAGSHRGWLLDNSDWLFPLAHPFWAVRFDPLDSVDWILTRHDYLAASTDRRIIFKELGFPSWCENGCTEEQQSIFYSGLKRTKLSFFHFEAFDQSWKPGRARFGQVEGHWGLFKKSRYPKAFMKARSPGRFDED